MTRTKKSARKDATPRAARVSKPPREAGYEYKQRESTTALRAIRCAQKRTEVVLSTSEHDDSMMRLLRGAQLLAFARGSVVVLATDLALAWRLTGLSASFGELAVECDLEVLQEAPEAASPPEAAPEACAEAAPEASSPMESALEAPAEAAPEASSPMEGVLEAPAKAVPKALSPVQQVEKLAWKASLFGLSNTAARVAVRASASRRFR